MGKYLNKGNDGFRSARNSEFVDKSQLIEIVNATLNSERQYTCVSRARRFGKSIGAEMLYAYYDQWCAEEELFADLKAYSSPSFQRHFRRYPVLYLDMTDFITSYYKDDDIVAKMQSAARTTCSRCSSTWATSLTTATAARAGSPTARLP